MFSIQRRRRYYSPQYYCMFVIQHVANHNLHKAISWPEANIYKSHSVRPARVTSPVNRIAQIMEMTNNAAEDNRDSSGTLHSLHLLDLDYEEGGVVL